MYHQGRKLVTFANNTRFLGKNRCISRNSYINVNEEVMLGLETGKPVVALESTIITHGMPFPDNVECAFHVENIVRNQVSRENAFLVVMGLSE